MHTRTDLIREVKDAVTSGSLLTAKHDPNSGLTWDRFRTVLTPQVSASLQKLIESEQYDLHGYFNHLHNKHSYVLVPHDTASYAVVGHGIPSGSTETTGSYDRLLIVSGSVDGWHIYTDDSAKISAQVSSGSIRDDGML